MITIDSIFHVVQYEPPVRLTVTDDSVTLSTRAPTGQFTRGRLVLFWNGDRWCEPSKLPADTQKAWSKILGTPALSERLRGMMRRAGAPDLGR